MTSKNLFKDAVEKNETAVFFKGEGRYFVRNPDWGDHIYAAHYGGHVNSYLIESDENKLIFSSSLNSFIQNLTLNEKDVDHLFGNLSAIVYWRSKGYLSSFETIEKNSDLGDSIAAYMDRLKDSATYQNKKELITNYIDAITKENSILNFNIN